MDNKKTISIVEDNKELCSAMKSMIEYSNIYTIIGTYHTSEDALSEISNYPPDLVLMDINLNEISGIELVSILKNHFPNMLFLMCTSLEENEKIFQSLKAGASGYILKTDGMHKILQAIEDVFDGGAPMSHFIARKVIDSFKVVTPENIFLQQLTEREQEVLTHLSKGFMNKEIALQLQLSEGTVRKHIENIYKKLQVNTRVEAVNKLNFYK